MPGSSEHVVPAGENFTYLRVIGRALNYCCVMREARLLPVLDSLAKGFNLKLFIHNYHP